MALVRGGITVKPHVQAFADFLESELGPLSFGTYPGHSDPEGPTQAIDVFNPDTSAGHRLQDRICDLVKANARRFGIRYCIRREYIWNIERDAEGWRKQSHKGNRRLDHYDHVHITFYATAPGPFGPTVPIIKPPIEGNDNEMVTIFYQYKKEDWFMDRASKTYGRLPFGSLIEGMAAHGDAHKYGPQDEVFHKGVIAWAMAAGFSGIFTE